MRLYAIFMYVLILDLVFGFVTTAIQAGWFLPEAQGVVNLPSGEAFSDALTQFQNISNSFADVDSGWEWLGTALTALVWGVGTGISLLFSVFGSLPAFIMSIMGLDTAVVSALTPIFSALFAVLAVFTAIQLITGKWFSFVE